MRIHSVPDGVQAMTLARYFARAYPMLPGHVARALFQKKDVRVNGVKADGAAIVRGGDTVAVYLPDDVLLGAVATIYRDEDIWAVEKAPGLPVDADQDGIGEDTLIKRLRRDCPEAKLAHRLDAGTGGVVLASVSDAGEAMLADAFERHTMRKIYIAQLSAMPARRSDTLVHYLVKDAAHSRVRAFEEKRPGAVRAELSYTIVEAGTHPIARIALVTGRTHQIRCQFAKIGCAIVGDDKYGDRALNRQLRAARPRLWCHEIELDIPRYTARPFVSQPDFYSGTE